MNPEHYLPLAEHLASRGFVVLGPEHAEVDWAADILQTTADRPLAISATIDLAEDGALDGIIDTDRVAVVGHSWGGYTAFAVAGARIDLDDLAQRCDGATDPFIAGYFCAPFADGDGLAEAFGLDETPSGRWPSLADDRVDAIVPIASDAFLFGDDELAEVTTPMLIIGGTADTGAPWDWGTGLAYREVGSEVRYLAAFEGGEHMIPVLGCESMPWTANLPDAYQSVFCEDPAWDKQEALDLVNHLTTAFLRHTLVDGAKAEDALQPEAYEVVEGLELRVGGE